MFGGASGFGLNAFGANAPNQNPSINNQQPGLFGAGQQQQQQQQQPVTGTAFGGAAGFGGNAFGGQKTGGFGGGIGSGFGGGLGSGIGGMESGRGSAATTSGFGGNTQGAFGASGGGGLFGATPSSGQSSGGLFGANKPAFGAPSGASSAFGGGAVAIQPTGAGFGFGIGGPQLQQQQPLTAGTNPFKPLEETESAGGSTKKIVYQSISAVDPYKNSSHEELRWADYQANKKFGTPQQQQQGFGSNAFGSTTAANTSGFGGSAFGATPSQSTMGGFGGGAASSGTPGFSGATSSAFGGFGGAQQQQQQQPQPQTGGLFGQTPSVGAFGQAPSTGGFGQTNIAMGGMFGQAAAAPATSGFGFSQQQNKPAFGAGGAFGAASAQPAGFGVPASTSGFGGFGGAATAAPTLNTGGLFGAQQQPKPATGFGFGAQPAATTGGMGLFGAAPTTAGAGMFGQQPQQNLQQQQQGQTGFGAPAGNLFGGGFGQANKPVTGGFGFGQPAQAQTSQPGTSLFGAPATAPTAGFGAPGGLFGAPAVTSQAPTMGLFGAPPTLSGMGQPGGMFGGQQQLQQQPGMLGFGAPAAQMGGSSLFGSKPANLGGASNFAFPSVSLGGMNPAATAAPSMSLFGGATQSVAPTGSMFGATFQPGNTGSLFGMQPPVNSLGTPSSGLVASIDKTPYGTLPVFEGTKISASEPTATPSKDKKRPSTGYMSTYRVTPRTTTTLPLRGFYSSQSASKERDVKSFDTKIEDELLTSLSTRKSAKTLEIRPSNTVVSFRVDANGSGLSSRGRLSSSSALSPAATPFNTDSLSFSATPRSSAKVFGSADKRKSVTFATDIRYAGEGDDIADTTFEEADSWAPTTPSHSGGNANVLTALSSSSIFVNSVKSTPPLNFATPQKTTRLSGSGSAGKSGHRKVRATSTEYYIEPEVDALMSMEDEELRAVENFTVGLAEFGQVKFCQPVDLLAVGATLNPSNPRDGIREIPVGIVTFEPRTVAVYPDEASKAPEGTGLNVPAEIQLVDCWPMDKSTKAKIREPAHPIFVKHVEKLKRMKDTEFVGFDTASGVWTFRVQHFSRYGLVDDDSDDEGESTVVPMKDYDFERKGVAELLRARRRMGKKDVIITEQELTIEEMDSALSVTGSETLESLLQDGILEALEYSETGGDEDRGYEGQDVLEEESMGEKFIIEEHLKLENEMADVDFPVVQPSGVLSPKRPAVADYEANGAVLMETHRDFREGFDHSESMNHDENEFKAVFKKPTKYFRINRVPFNRTHSATGKTRSGNLATDAGVMLGRSFRVGWAPNGTLLSVGSILQSENDLKMSAKVKSATDWVVTTLNIYQLAPFGGNPVDLKLEKERHDIMFKILLDNVQVTSRGNVPLFTVNDKVVFNDVYERLKTANTTRGDELFSKDELLIWKLASALFDKTSADFEPDLYTPDQIDYAQVCARKESFSQWLKDATEDSCESDAEAGKDAKRPLQSVFHYLTGRKMIKACKSAVSSGNMYLATVISQCSGPGVGTFRNLDNNVASYGHGIKGSGGLDMDVLNFLREQLGVWEDSKGVVDKDVEIVYRLLCGDANSWREADVLGSMSDWRRCLALIFWYLEGGMEDVVTAVEAFESLVEDCKPPHPPYAPAGNNGFRDLAFHLVKLFANPMYDLKSMLSPLTITAHSLDYRMVWVLVLLLWKGRNVGHMRMNFDKRAPDFDAATAKLIFQLENIGCIDWAIFTSLASSTAEDLTKSLLGRVYPMYDDYESCLKVLRENGSSKAWPMILVGEESRLYDFLTDNLSIPSAWVHDAKAKHAMLCGHNLLEIVYLIDAHDYNKAHKKLIYKVVPNAILRGCTVELYDLLKLLPSSVENYATGAGLLLEFFNAKQVFAGKQHKKDVERKLLAQRLRSILIQLKTGIAWWFELGDFASGSFPLSTSSATHLPAMVEELKGTVQSFLVAVDY